jgi:hypothetical protein
VRSSVVYCGKRTGAQELSQKLSPLLWAAATIAAAEPAVALDRRADCVDAGGGSAAVSCLYAALRAAMSASMVECCACPNPPNAFARVHSSLIRRRKRSR